MRQRSWNHHSALEGPWLQGLHEPHYLRAFLQGVEPLASSQGIAWSPGVRDSALAMLGGQIQAARHALEGPDGIAMNIARGFHHAHPAGGSGFCPLNGLALVAHVFPRLRIMVIDCDEHGGNGTEEFAARMPNLYAASVFGSRFGCMGGRRSWAWQVKQGEGFSRYQAVLDEIGQLAGSIAPDLILYQAGADCHHADPKSRLRLTTREMFRRDLAVFAIARRLRVPILFVLEGGYQSAERVAYLNANTVRAARRVWGRIAG